MMHAVLADFRTKLQLGDTIFLYFFGFAVSYGGKNYLLPADASVPVMKEDVAQFGIDIDSTLEMLHDAVGDNGIKIAILEASAPVQFCHRGGKALQGIDINAIGGNMFIQVCTAESEPALYLVRKVDSGLSLYCHCLSSALGSPLHELSQMCYMAKIC